jgi:hypothetical protein
MKVKMLHSTGIVKNIKVGYSWTSLFFGFIVPMTRGQWSDCAVMLFAAAPTVGILPLVWTFKINKRYCQVLLEKGYKPQTPEDSKILVQNGYYVVPAI